MALDAEEVGPAKGEGKVVGEESLSVVDGGGQPIEITHFEVVVGYHFELVGIEEARTGGLLLLEVEHQSAEVRGEVFESVGGHGSSGVCVLRVC